MDTDDSTTQLDRAVATRRHNTTVSEPVRLIAEQLLSRIESGEYKSRLPAERQLAKEFDVPRNAIRGALDLLIGRGVIGRRAGSGNFVLDSATESASNGTSPSLQNVVVAENTGPHKLQAVRDIFEPELVRLAVVHTSPKNIQALKKVVEKMELITADAEAFVLCEESFCIQLARGTENPLLIAIYELITDVRRLSNWRAQRQKSLSPTGIKQCRARYRSMFDAIEYRDAGRAVEFLKLQLTDEQRGPAGDN